jgi:glycosyltransferase involved in cell wall biosynthesis
MGAFCVILPAYQEEKRIGAVVRSVLPLCPDVVVVDDGSADATAKEAGKAGATVLRHAVNQGKGVALNTGFAYAREHAFEFVITMDADGQHDPADIPAFVEAYRTTGAPVLVGNRMDRTGPMPFVRKLTNLYTSWVISRRIGQRVPDTQCGYRLYRCSEIPPFSGEFPRFAAESEVLLQLGERGLKIGAVPIRVIYADEKSKISPLKDTIRFFAMLRRIGRRGRRPKT